VKRTFELYQGQKYSSVIMTSINTLVTSIFYIYTVFFDDRQDVRKVGTCCNYAQIKI